MSDLEPATDFPVHHAGSRCCDMTCARNPPRVLAVRPINAFASQSTRLCLCTPLCPRGYYLQRSQCQPKQCRNKVTSNRPATCLYLQLTSRYITWLKRPFPCHSTLQARTIDKQQSLNFFFRISLMLGNSISLIPLSTIFILESLLIMYG